MTKQDYMTIFYNARDEIIEQFDSEDCTDMLTEDECRLWRDAVGEDEDGNQLPVQDPMRMYDAFMAAFVNDSMAKMEWADNVEFKEFWAEKGQKDKMFLSPSDVGKSPDNGRTWFRFMANGRINGVDVPSPAGYPAWLFQLEVDSFSPPNSNVSLMVKYRDDERHIIVHTRFIRQCQAAVIIFLHTAYRHFRNKGMI